MKEEKIIIKIKKKPKDRIISIPYLAQAVSAIVLQRPNDSRGRPISLIKNEKLYSRIFSEEYPIELYLECVQFMKSIEDYLRSEDVPENLRGHSDNIRYQLAMFASAVKAKRLTLKPAYIQKNGLKKLDPSFLTQQLKEVLKLVESTKKKWDVDEDRIAKSPDFDELLRNKLKETLHPKLL